MHVSPRSTVRPSATAHEQRVQPGQMFARRPHMMVRSFNTSNSPLTPRRSSTDPRRPSAEPDKSVRLLREEQDKSVALLREEQDKALGVTTFGAHATGVNIVVDASTGSTTAARAARGAGVGALAGAGAGIVGAGIAALTGAGAGLAAGLILGGAALGAVIGGIAGALSGEYRFVQTIDTNVPLGGSTSPYVDPRPNDDSKPFYWTDAEHEQHGNRFIDGPSRAVPSSGTTRWDATLSVAHVADKSVSILESLKYGFSLDSGGTVTTRAPTSTSSTTSHVSTLSGSFPDWTFRQG